MPSTVTAFNANAHLTLFFPQWTTSTRRGYGFMIAFIIVLGVLSRFLVALKVQWERSWVENQGYEAVASSDMTRDTLWRQNVISSNRHSHDVEGIELMSSHSNSIENGVPPPKKQNEEETTPLRSDPAFTEDNEDRRESQDEEEIDLLRLDPVFEGTEDHEIEPKSQLCVHNGSWSWKRDGVRASLQLLYALVAYLLMLAVMTHHVGFFFSAIGSIFLGDLVFGRYA